MISRPSCTVEYFLSRLDPNARYLNVQTASNMIIPKLIADVVRNASNVLVNTDLSIASTKADQMRSNACSARVTTLQTIGM